MVRGVIFDVDGTLLDSVDLHAHAWQDAFAAFGHKIGFDDIRAQIGKGGDQLMPVFLSAASLDQIGKPLEARRGEIFRERYMDQVITFPMVRPLFLRLLDTGYKIALASSAKQQELETYKKLARIDDLLDAETSADDAAHSKPHPDIFNAALARLDGAKADDVFVIGDTPYDAQAAAKAGMRTVGMMCGGWPDAALRQAGCIAVYQDPAALLAAYEASIFAPRA